MRRTRRERKAYEQGRAAGYAEGYTEGYAKGYTEGYAKGYTEGYAKGLHDGNPFIMMAEAIADAVSTITENPRDPEFEDVLEIEEGGDDE